MLGVINLGTMNETEKNPDTFLCLGVVTSL